MIEYLFLILAIPTGIILQIITKKEKEIYTKPKYFPSMIWILAILSAIFLTVDKTIGMPLTFMTITIFTWLNFHVKN
jgi:hypothetical protein